jgi:O-antigen ligase
MDLFSKSPFVGHGFNADRLILGAHTHNSFVHSLVQTGILGAVAFFAAVLAAWILTIKMLRQIGSLPREHKNLVITTAGVLAFFTMRGITESSGAFFGVDFLLLAPLFLYLLLVDRSMEEKDNQGPMG